MLSASFGPILCTARSENSATGWLLRAATVVVLVCNEGV